MHREKLERSAIYWRFFFAAVIVLTMTAALYPNFKLSSLLYSLKVHDGMVHMAAFTTVTVIAACAWRVRVLMIVSLVLFSLALEAAQAFSPGRDVSLSDAAASLSGIALGMLLLAFTQSVRRSILRWT